MEEVSEVYREKYGKKAYTAKAPEVWRCNDSLKNLFFYSKIP